MIAPESYLDERVTERLRRMSELSDLTTTRRLATKVDMSPEGIERRLKLQSDLRDYCLRLAAATPHDLR